MKNDLDQKPAKDAEVTKSLSNLLGQNEHVGNLVEESAEELTMVNLALKEEVAKQISLPAVQNALQKSEAVEKKVQDASEKLATVNRALGDQIQDRHLLEDRLAEVTEQEAAARYAAFHDPLTGLSNRALFKDRLEHGLAQAMRHDWSLAVMFVDLDGFKGVNDTYGHDVGDRILQEVARRLTQNTRDDDTVSRLGGDEFLYLLMEAGAKQDIFHIAQKIIRAIQMPIEVSGGECPVSLSIGASIGISIFPQDGSNADTLVRNADQAMYEAKRTKSGYAFAR